MNLIFKGIFILLLVFAIFVVAHPRAEDLHKAEYPAPPSAPFVKPIVEVIVDKEQQLDISIIEDPVYQCPAPSRGFDTLYAKYANKYSYGKPAHFACLIHSIAERESNQKPDAISPVGAEGMMQIMPPTAKDLNVNPLIPDEAIDGAARYIVWLSKRFPHVKENDLPLFELAAYNLGVGRVRRTGCITYICLEPLLPVETKNYVAGVTEMARTGRWI